MRGLVAIGFTALLACAGCAETPTVSNVTLTSGAGMAQGRRIPVSSVGLADRVVMLVDFTWPDPGTDAGLHECEWRWYRAGQLVSDTPAKRLYFISTPFTLRTARPAAPLGIGNYTVDTLVDGSVVATSRFTITG